MCVSEVVGRAMCLYTCVTGPDGSGCGELRSLCIYVCTRENLPGPAHVWGGQLGAMHAHTVYLYQCPSVCAHMRQWPSVPSSVKWGSCSFLLHEAGMRSKFMSQSQSEVDVNFYCHFHKHQLELGQSAGRGQIPGRVR